MQRNRTVSCSATHQMAPPIRGTTEKPNAERRRLTKELIRGRRDTPKTLAVCQKPILARFCEANDHPTLVDFLHQDTDMLLAELMFAMCGNANYEPDDNIILESTQIIPQTDEDCLDLVIDEPSSIAQKHRKIGVIWSSTVPLIWQATFQKTLQKIYCELCKSNICQQCSNCHSAAVHSLA
ncbi:hypothetical protein AVEN_222156-1 [Araneus ventricosus]|uniref:Uncharacterized protein n=1 Tax=Araneus ventricosus TaxID=182803 RepID=A0A4Y2SBZ1_ARAVE|nr:hypothetical protein AVEN_222156-1 [Araneus ventricosus]